MMTTRGTNSYYRTPPATHLEKCYTPVDRKTELVGQNNEPHTIKGAEHNKGRERYRYVQYSTIILVDDSSQHDVLYRRAKSCD